MVLVVVAIAESCRIPVFRYALERWPPGTFELVLFHSGELTGKDAATLQQFQRRVQEKDRPANVRMETINVARDELSHEQRQLGQSVGIDIDNLKIPHAVLLFPRSRGRLAVAWHGPFSTETLDAVIDSPARQQIAEWILGGESAVWVLIESSDKAVNDAAAELLDVELDRVAELIKLPPQEVLEADEEFQAGTGIALRIGFRSIRLSRNDLAEAPFIQMLLNSEPDLATYDAPIAVPIFGRGRTYYALVGKGIKPKLIEANSRFVCGDCSCQVKEENPGSDLLFAVDWDEGIRGTAFPSPVLPELTGIGSLDVIDLGQYERQARAEQTGEHPAGTRPTDRGSRRVSQMPNDLVDGTRKGDDLATSSSHTGEANTGHVSTAQAATRAMPRRGMNTPESETVVDRAGLADDDVLQRQEAGVSGLLTETGSKTDASSPIARSLAPVLGLALVVALVGIFLLRS